MNTFIYALCEPGTRIIRYIGKSKHPKRRFREHLKTSVHRGTHCGNWIEKLQKSGSLPDLLVLKEVPLNEWEWWEQCYIRNARMLGFDLVNSTDGGEGVHNPTEESRKKLSRINSGKTIPEEVRKKISEGGKLAWIKRKERGDKSHLVHLGKKFSLETRHKMSLAQRGEKHPLFGKHHSEDSRKKMSDSRLGRRFSEEHKKNLSDSLKRSWMAKKAKV